MSYSPNEEAKLEPEYADVYGVPFSFLPCSGTTKIPKPGPTPTRVRALAERIAWPRLLGDRYELPGERLTAKFTSDAKFALTNADLPTKTEIEGIVGEIRIDTLDDLKRRRMNEVAFTLMERGRRTRRRKPMVVILNNRQSSPNSQKSSRRGAFLLDEGPSD